MITEKTLKEESHNKNYYDDSYSAPFACRSFAFDLLTDILFSCAIKLEMINGECLGWRSRAVLSTSAKTKVTNRPGLAESDKSRSASALTSDILVPLSSSSSPVSKIKIANAGAM